MSKELTECPFCYSKDVEPNRTEPETRAMPRIYWVNCNNCGATGPEGKDLEEAISKWEKGIKL